MISLTALLLAGSVCSGATLNDKCFEPIPLNDCAKNYKGQLIGGLDAITGKRVCPKVELKKVKAKGSARASLRAIR